MYRKRPLRHFYVYGCKAKVKLYNLFTKKLDLKTISGYFIEYCNGSKSGRFYYPTNTTRVIKFDTIVYFKDWLDSEHQKPHISFGKEHIVICYACKWYIKKCKCTLS